MIRQKKEKVIEELADNLNRCVVAIATDYRGLTAKEMVQLRKQLYTQGVQYIVVKNTLARFAAEKANKKGIEQFFSGPLALAIGYDDAIKPAKILTEYIKSTGSALKVKGGILDDRVLSSVDIFDLATIPSKEVLIGQVIGRLKAPLYLLHFELGSPLRSIVGVFQARVRQLEGN